MVTIPLLLKRRKIRIKTDALYFFEGFPVWVYISQRVFSSAKVKRGIIGEYFSSKLEIFNTMLKNGGAFFEF